MSNQDLGNPNIQMQGQTIPLPQMSLPQQGNIPFYGPGNTIVGYTDNNRQFYPAQQYTGAQNNQSNLQDKELLNNPELLKKYVQSKDTYKFQSGGFKWDNEDDDFLFGDDEEGTVNVAEQPRQNDEEVVNQELQPEVNQEEEDINNALYAELMTPYVRKNYRVRQPYQTVENTDGPTLNIKPSENKNFAFNYLQQKGLAPHQAAGIVGNFAQESNVNPNITNSIGAFGAGQWLGARKKALFDFAKRNGQDPANLQTQLDFTMHELNTTEKGAFNTLKGTKTSAEAAQVFRKKYERPGEHEANDNRRIQEARKLHPFQKGGTKINFPKFDPTIIQQKPIIDNNDNKFIRKENKPLTYEEQRRFRELANNKKATAYKPSFMTLKAKSAIIPLSYSPNPVVKAIGTGLSTGADLATSINYLADGQYGKAEEDFGQALLNLIPGSIFAGYGVKGDKMYKTIKGLKVLKLMSDSKTASETFKKGGKINDNNGYLISNLHNFTPKKIINSNYITTQGMAFPIQANNQILYPNTGDYIFPTNKVVEKPMYQDGGFLLNGDVSFFIQKPKVKKFLKENGSPKLYQEDGIRANYDPIANQINFSQVGDLIPEFSHVVQKVNGNIGGNSAPPNQSTIMMDNNQNLEVYPINRENIDYNKVSQDAGYLNNLKIINTGNTGSMQNAYVKKAFGNIYPQSYLNKLNDSNIYMTPGSSEYEAHQLIEPNLGSYLTYKKGGTYYVSNADIANLKQKRIKFRYV